MKKIFVNLVCLFIPVRKIRRRVRVQLTHPIIRKMTAFAKSFSTNTKPKIRYTYGFRFANFVVTVDDKWVFKFPLTGDAREISIREKRITDALRSVSPLKIPKMEILDWNGVSVRRYEYIHGIGFHKLSNADQIAHADTIAKQLAKFLYVPGMVDPKEIRDLKSKKSDKPSIMHGWNQNDLWDNFLMDPKNFKITGVIDWESANFNDFYVYFTSGTGNRVVKKALLREYLKIIRNK